MGASDHHYLGAERHLRDVLAFFGAIPMPVAVYLNGGDFDDGVPGERAATAARRALRRDRRDRRGARRRRRRPRAGAAGGAGDQTATRRRRPADADRRDADRRTASCRRPPLAAAPPAEPTLDALPDSSVRAIVIDAHAPARIGLAALLDEQPWIERCLLASGSEESVALTRRHRPDVAILDISQTGPFAGSITAAIREAHPGVQILLSSRCRTSPGRAARQPRRGRLPARRGLRRGGHRPVRAAVLAGEPLDFAGRRARRRPRPQRPRARDPRPARHRPDQPRDRRAPPPRPRQRQEERHRALPQARRPQPHRGRAARRDRPRRLTPAVPASPRTRLPDSPTPKEHPP